MVAPGRAASPSPIMPDSLHPSGSIDVPRPPSSKVSTVASPCVRDCCLDEADVCMGCGRALDEILRWHAASDEEREAILVAAKARVAERRARRW